MAQVVEFGPRDQAKVRFAVSPLWETFAAVRMVGDERRRGHHLPWLEAVRARARKADLGLLQAFTPRQGWTPDFLLPIPAGPSAAVEDQLALVRATPLEVVRADLARTLDDRGGEPAPRAVVALAADPDRARSVLADALGRVWAALVAPHWGTIGALLDADVAHRSRRVGSYGLERAVAEIDPRLRWEGTNLTVAGPGDERCTLGGGGMVLLPSAFSYPNLTAVPGAAPQPAIVYPARGIAELWTPAPVPPAGALQRLLGATRATLLLSLTDEATTTVLARRFGLSPSTVSEHLAVLRDAGLVSSRRVAATVVYVQTDLGAEVANLPR